MTQDPNTAAPQAAGADTGARKAFDPTTHLAQPTTRVIGDPAADPTSATLRLYAADWARFTAWCRQQGRSPLPASPQTLAAYLLAAAPGVSRGTIGRRRAAIGTLHRQAGLPIPLLDAATQKALRTSARPKPPPRAKVVTSAHLRRMAARCASDLTGLRDGALLLLAAALTRPRPRSHPSAEGEERATGEGVPRRFLLGLDAEHVQLTALGMTLHIRSRMDDQEPSRVMTLTRTLPAQTCPVRAMQDWLRASDTAFGPVFRKVDRWGNVEHGRLHPDAWNRILARRSGPPPPARTAPRLKR